MRNSGLPIWAGPSPCTLLASVLYYGLCRVAKCCSPTMTIAALLGVKCNLPEIKPNHGIT